MVGPGKAFNTDKYFVICSNVLGGCRGSTGPSSINPATGAPYGADFPLVTIGDMVRAQKELITSLGIDILLSVAGGSMGGMQALDWAIRFPDALKSVIIVASTHLSGAQQIAFDAVGRNAIRADSDFQSGAYYGGPGPAKGLSVARMLAHITYLSDESMRAKFGRDFRANDAPHYDFESEYAVETYLDYQGKQFVERFDANSYLYITKAMDYFDVGAGHESLDQALSGILAKVLIVSFSSDWLYPPYQSEEIMYALARERKNVSYCAVHSDYGHDAFLLEIDTLSQLVGGFVHHVAYPDGATPPDGQPTASAEEEGDESASYASMVELVEPRSRVLDVGCGSGKLLAKLVEERQIVGMGLERSQAPLVRAVHSGLSVIHADVDEGLAAFPDNCFDYATLSMTFQVIEHPRLVLKELVRVANKCILSFPNFAHWSVRSQVFFGGISPITKGLPYSWDTTPNRHFFSIKDFRKFCRQLDIRIEKEIPLGSHPLTRLWPNAFAKDALYVVSAMNR
jgi:homoserine O-acetyltransferase